MEKNDKKRSRTTIGVGEIIERRRSEGHKRPENRREILAETGGSMTVISSKINKALQRSPSPQRQNRKKNPRVDVRSLLNEARNHLIELWEEPNLCPVKKKSAGAFLARMERNRQFRDEIPIAILEAHPEVEKGNEH